MYGLPVKGVTEVLQPGLLPFREMDGDDIETKLFMDTPQFLEKACGLSDAFDLLLVDGGFGVAVEESAAALHLYSNKVVAFFTNDVDFPFVPPEIAGQDGTSDRVQVMGGNGFSTGTDMGRWNRHAFEGVRTQLKRF